MCYLNSYIRFIWQKVMWWDWHSDFCCANNAELHFIYSCSYAVEKILLLSSKLIFFYNYTFWCLRDPKIRTSTVGCTLKDWKLLILSLFHSFLRENASSRTWVNFRYLKLSSLHIYKIWYLKWKVGMV